jgi:co-chaperonin GroES (HSP10)
MQPFAVLGKRALVRSTKPPEVVSDGGIVAPEAAIDRPVVGVVMAAGPDSNFVVGQEVLLAKLTGVAVHSDPKEWWSVFNDEDILGVIERYA